jgi:heme O synthase-like polyprenyltransferase
MRVDYVIAAVVGLAVSYFSVTIFMMGGGQFASWVIAFLVFAYIGAYRFVSERKSEESTGLGVLALISPPFIVWIGLFLYYKVSSLIG